jgi:pSer/pThr/pTyr-binding forkhead associated (FHA) protein
LLVRRNFHLKAGAIAGYVSTRLTPDITPTVTNMRQIVFTFTNGSKEGTSQALVSEDNLSITFGTSEECTVQFDSTNPVDNVVQRNHAEITVDETNGRYLLLNPEISNKTFLNKRLIYEPQQLAPEDVIQFGVGGPSFTFDLEPRRSQRERLSTQAKGRLLAALGIISSVCVVVFSFYRFINGWEKRIHSEDDDQAVFTPREPVNVDQIPMSRKTVAYIESIWSVRYGKERQKVYQKHEESAGRFLPVFVRMRDQSLQPWLTLSEGEGHNIEMIAMNRSLSIILNQDGRLLSTKATTVPAEGNFGFDTSHGVRIYSIGCIGKEDCFRDLPAQRVARDRSLRKWTIRSAKFLTDGNSAQIALPAESPFRAEVERISCRLPESEGALNCKVASLASGVDISVFKAELQGKFSAASFASPAVAPKPGDDITILSYPVRASESQTPGSEPLRTRAPERLPFPENYQGKIIEILRQGDRREGDDSRLVYLARMYSRIHLAEGAPVLNHSGAVIGVFTQAPWLDDEAVIIPIATAFEYSGPP